jgi:hypothetical protein
MGRSEAMTNTAQKSGSVSKKAVRAIYPHANACGPNDGWQVFETMMNEKALGPKCKTAQQAWQAALAAATNGSNT